MAYEVNISRDRFLPCYHHLLEVPGAPFFDIDFLYGGRDSGKSRHIAMQLVLSCLGGVYFRCLLIRRVLNTVRDSQYSLIGSVIEEWGLGRFFKFNSSRLEIMCVNGNGFYGRGLDDVGKIKSFNNPSHCWVEEGNQVSHGDFVVVLTSLRGNGRVKTWFSFNPECEVNYTEFWLYQEYFAHTKELSFEWVKLVETDEGPVEFKIRATHTTYRDNAYCKPQRRALYEGYRNSKNGGYWYQTYTLGLWGFRKSGGAFFDGFDEGLHCRDLELLREPVHVVLDNNLNPYISIAVWQVDAEHRVLRQQHELPCGYPDNSAGRSARRLVKWLRGVGFDDVIYIRGDASANNRSTVDDNNASFFDRFIEVLEDEGYVVVNCVERSNPRVQLSGEFINEIYVGGFEGWSISINSSCRVSIEDYVMAKRDSDGRILKRRVTNVETGQSYEEHGHFCDTKRYLVCGVLADEFERYGNRSRGGLRYV